MKNLIILFSFLLLAGTIQAQTPDDPSRDENKADESLRRSTELYGHSRKRHKVTSGIAIKSVHRSLPRPELRTLAP